MRNKVALHKDGYIEMFYIGEQDAATMRESFDEMKRLIERLRQQKRPVHILADTTQQKEIATDGRKVAAEALRSIPFDKVTVICPSNFRRALTRLIASAARKSHKVSVFETRAEAEQWLATQPTENP